MNPSPVGVVLAGGQSRRLGHDKALVALDGEALVDRAVRRLGAVCEVVAVADRGRGRATSGRSVADGPGRGPAAGILGAAQRYPSRELVVVACDLPLVPLALLRWLARPSLVADWTVPRHAGRLEPLCARYGLAALAALAVRVGRGDFALHPLGDEPSLVVDTVSGAALAAFGDPDTWLLNVNEPDDLKRLAALRLEG